MFNLRDFIMQGFYDAIGILNEYQIILNASGWYQQGVLTQEDLSKLQQAITDHNIKQYPL